MDDARKRLTDFANLKENWDSYGSPPPTPVVLEIASTLLGQVGALFAPPPLAYPTASGGVVLEWDSPPGSPTAAISLEVEPSEEISLYFEIGELNIETPLGRLP